MFRGQRDKGLGASGQENLEDEDYAVIIPSGAACLLRRDMVDEVGLFSEDFFAYADDTDLALRAQLAGWCCVLARGAVAYHHYSSTAGAYSSMKIFYAERNRIWILIKFFPLSMIIKSWYYTLVRYLAVIYYLFRDRKSRDRRARPGFSITGSLTAVIKAYFSAAKGISRQCAERKKLCTSARARGRLFSEWLKPGTSSGKFRLDLKSLSSMD
jgi:GT2 family glycosyltransferase